MENSEDPKQSSNTENPNKVFSWALYMELGTEFAVSTALPLLIFLYLGPILHLAGLESAGDWANRQRHSSVGYKVVGILTAMALSYYMVYRKIKEIRKILYK